MWWLTKTTPSGRFELHLLKLQRLSYTLLLNGSCRLCSCIADFLESHLSLVSKNLQCRQPDYLKVRQGSALCAFHCIMKYSNNNYYATYKTILDFFGGPQLKNNYKESIVRGACLYLNSKKSNGNNQKPFGENERIGLRKKVTETRT